MANSENKIPKSLKDCYETNRVSGELWRWADWFDKWGGVVLVILIIIGIISTIIQGTQVANIDEDLVLVTVLTSIVTWILYAFFEYCIYNILSALMGALATIVQNTTVSANVALYTAAKEDDTCTNNKNNE